MRSAVIAFALACLEEDDFYPPVRFLQYSHYPETKPPKGKGKIQGLGQIHMRRHKSLSAVNPKGNGNEPRKHHARSSADHGG